MSQRLEKLKEYEGRSFKSMTKEERADAKVKYTKQFNDKFGHLLPDRALKSPADFVKGFRVNVTNEDLLKNINYSIRLGLQQFCQSVDQPGPVCIVGGGWSLEETLPELLDLAWKGAPVIALNGAGRYLLDRNIRAGCQIVLDARKVNKAFVEKEIPGCKYLIASQCPKEVFDLCKDRDVHLYHVVSTDEDDDTKNVLNDFYDGHWVNVIGGSTVGMRSITLARHMGFRQMHLFGFDSCYSPDGKKHHSYEQKWNDGEQAGHSYWALNSDGGSDGRDFTCSIWQASQAQNFSAFLALNGKHFRLHIHGDGLLAYILKTGAKLSTKPKD